MCNISMIADGEPTKYKTKHNRQQQQTQNNEFSRLHDITS